MGYNELKIRKRIQDWKAYPKPHPEDVHLPHIRPAEARDGIKDRQFGYYDSWAYEIVEDGRILGRAEGEDALERIELVLKNLKVLRR